MANLSFSFEIYTCNPLTKESGWDIHFVNVFAPDMTQAKQVLKSVPDFDCIILFNHSTVLDEKDLEVYANGGNYRFTTGYPYYS